MANANISAIQLTNTFDQWRTVTNDLVNDRNLLRNYSYVKDEKDFTIANGALIISNADRGSANIARDVAIGRDLNVTNTIITSNIIVTRNVTTQNITVANLWITNSIAGPGFQGVGGGGPGGIQGAQGIQGSQGVVGSQGASGSQGATGIAGSQGASGPQGFVGGPQGVQGAAGGGPGSNIIVKEEGTNITTALTSINFIGTAITAQAVGPPGEVNVTVTGGLGAQGAQGVVGAQGSQGIIGAQGQIGIGVQGHQGLSGSGGSITDDTSSGTTHYPLLTTATSGTLTGVKVSSTKLSFLPSTGTVTATDFAATSDIGLKNVIKNIPKATEKLTHINGVEFTWNSKAKNIGVSDSNQIQVGVVAQEIEKLYPSMVTNHEDGYKRVNYDKLVPILIEAIKEMNERIKVLEGK
jgi:hypothetical protein